MEESLTDSMYFIMLALLKPQHGYAIMKEISQLTAGKVEIGPASMYTILKKLLKAQLIVLEESHERKKIYRLTPLGVETLKAEVVRREKLFRVGEIALKKAGVMDED